jgi:hypothetical protein
MKQKQPAPHCLSRQHPELARNNGSSSGLTKQPPGGRAPPSSQPQTPPRKHL